MFTAGADWRQQLTEVCAQPGTEDGRCQGSSQQLPGARECSPPGLGTVLPGSASQRRSQLERAAEPITPTAENILPPRRTARIYLYKVFPSSLALSDSANLQKAQWGVLKQDIKVSLPGRSLWLSP